MITNPSLFKDVYRTKEKRIEEYLVFTCHIPLLGFDKKYFYFANTDNLKKSLKRMPISLKLLSIISK